MASTTSSRWRQRQCSYKQPSDVLREHHKELCKILDGADSTLQSLTMAFYSRGIIDASTKNHILRKKGFKGADTLISRATLVLEGNPKKKEKVFKMMEQQEILQTIVQKMRRKSSRWQRHKSPPSLSSEDDEPETDLQSSTITSLSRRVDLASSETSEKNEENRAVTEAKRLQHKLGDLLAKITMHLRSVDVHALKLRLNWYFSREKENSFAVKKILEKIEQEQFASTNVLLILVRENMIGYLNYRLLEVFQQLINKAEIDQGKNEYEDAVESFLQLTDLGTLAKVFKDHPQVAPVTIAGLPQFTVHLNTDWEGRSLYSWEDILDKQCTWPHASHIHITAITRKCIIIQYSVLPFFAPAVVRDLTDPSVLALLKVHGVIMVELSDQLLTIGRDEEDTQCQPLPEEPQGLPSYQAPIDSSSDEELSLILSPPDTTPTISSKKRFTSTSKHTSTQEEKNFLLLKALRGWNDQSVEEVQSLINDGADVNTQDSHYWMGYSFTPLHYAAETGKTEIVELLMKSGADIHKETKNGNGYTPLHCAAERGKAEIVELLMKSGADIHKETKDGYTPLIFAAKSGKTEIVELLMKSGADVHKETKDGYSPLHFAAQSGETEIVELLVKSGADVHKETKKGETALLVFVDSLRSYNLSDAADMIHCLVSHGAKMNCRNKRGQTVLHRLLETNKIYLIHKPKFQFRLFRRSTSSIESPLLSVVKLLIDNGADVNAKDERGQTVLHCLLDPRQLLEDTHPRRSISDQLQSTLLSVVKLLIDNGADVNAKDEFGQTVLESLFEHHLFISDPHEKDYGYTPLHYAALNGEPKIVELLVKSGADIHKETKEGYTPLHFAAERGKIEIVELLVKSADIYKENKNISESFQGSFKSCSSYNSWPSSVHCSP